MFKCGKAIKAIMALVLIVAVGFSGFLPFNATDVSASPGFGYLRGHVYEGNVDNPIFPAKIRVENYDTGEFVGDYNNFADGSFYTVVSEGTYRLRVDAEGYVGEWYDNTYSGQDATPLAVAVDETIENIDFDLAIGGTISGNVRCQWHYGGLETRQNMSVVAHPADGSPYGFGACTESDGNYTIEGVPYGDYKVSASGRGHCTTNPDDERWMTQWYDGRDGFDTADVVTVGATPETGINFTLQEGGTIYGSVRDQNGTQFGVATVVVEDWYTGEWIAEVETSENGDFNVRGLASGDYLVWATAEGRELRYYENVASQEEAQPVHLEAPDSYHCWFNLQPGGSFSGTVFEADGITTIAGALVQAFDSTSGKHIRGVKAGVDGKYTFPGLAQGFYKVAASAPGFVREYYDADEGVPNFENAQVVAVVAAGDTKNIDFKLDPGGTILGTVVDATAGLPLANISIGIAAAISEDGVPYLPFDTCTDKEGNYTIFGLPFGLYKVYATGKGWCPGDPSYMEKWYDTYGDWEDATVITLDTDNSTATEIDFALEKGGAIRGLLTKAEDENPITWGGWVKVFMYAVEGPLEFVADGDVREDGSYIVEGLPTGDYLVVAGAEERAPKFYDNAYNQENATSVHVEAPGDATGINFNLKEGRYITGSVWNWYGERLVNFVVMAKRLDDGTRFFERTDDEGYYRMCVPFGSYKVAALGGDFYPEDPWYVTQWYDWAWSEEDAQIIEINEGMWQWWASFNLPRGGAISGRVTEANETTPIEGAWVEFFRWHDWEHIAYVETDADGYYRLLIESGDFRVQAGAEGYVSEFYEETTDPGLVKMVCVDEGSEIGVIDFTLEPGGIISGTTYEANGETPLPRVLVAATSVANPQDYFSTYSDEDGIYEISVPYGDYSIMAQGSEKDGGDPRYTREWYSEKTTWEDADIVTISTVTLSQTGINFSLELGGSISGTVTDEWGNTVWDAVITVRDATGMFAGSARMEYEGRYTVSGLASGEYQVTAWANGRSRVFYDNKTDWEEGDIVEVFAPDDTSEIDFQLIWAYGTISGDITYSGEVLDPASHEVIILAMDTRMAEMEGEEFYEYIYSIMGPGHYRIDNVGEGPYVLMAFLDADDNAKPSPGDPYGFYGEPTPVIITRVDDTWSWKAGIDIDITDGDKGIVTGKVEMELRDDYSSAIITVGTISTMSNKEGYYSLIVPPGTYDVIISMAGYLPARVPDVEVYDVMEVGPVELATTRLIIGDANNDEVINSSDLTLVAASFNTSPPVDDRADINADGTVDIYDLVLIGKRFGKTESQ